MEQLGKGSKEARGLAEPAGQLSRSCIWLAGTGLFSGPVGNGLQARIPRSLFSPGSFSVSCQQWQDHLPEASASSLMPGMPPHHRCGSTVPWTLKVYEKEPDSPGYMINPPGQDEMPELGQLYTDRLRTAPSGPAGSLASMKPTPRAEGGSSLGKACLITKTQEELATGHSLGSSDGEHLSTVSKQARGAPVRHRIGGLQVWHRCLRTQLLPTLM